MFYETFQNLSFHITSPGGGGLYRKAPPERGTCSYFQASDIWKWEVGISLVEVYKRVVKYVISACNKPKEAFQKRSVFMIYPYLKYSVFAAVKGIPGPKLHVGI